MKEIIEQKIKELEQSKTQFLANVNACEGGIQVLNELLKELENKEDKKK